MDHCTSHRRRPGLTVPHHSLAIGQPQIRYSDPNPPRSPMWVVVRSVLRGCKSSSVPPGPAPTASPVSGGRAAHDLACQFRTATSCGGELKGGRGWGSGGVARAWQALRLLDKPTCAVPCSFLSVFDPQPKSAPARSQNSSTPGRAHRVPGVFGGGTSCLRT